MFYLIRNKLQYIEQLLDIVSFIASLVIAADKNALMRNGLADPSQNMNRGKQKSVLIRAKCQRSTFYHQK